MSGLVRILVVSSVVMCIAPQTQARVSRADRAEARALYKQAVALERAGKAQDACLLFKKSYELHPKTKILWTAATACDEAGDRLLAQKFYRSYLSERRASWKLRRHAVERLVALTVNLHDAAKAEATSRDEKLKASQRKAEAAKYYKEGQESFTKERYEQAIKAFTLAYELYPSALDSLYNIAKSYERLGVGDKCITSYDRYVSAYRAAHNKKDPPDIRDIKNSQEKCRLGTKLEFTIETDPVGASVYIDDRDKLIGTSPLKTRLDPGEHVVFVEAPGYEPLEQKIEVRRGEARRLMFKLEKLQLVGHVKLNANIKGAAIYIDGRNIGLTPYTSPIALGVGSHQIKVQKQDYIDFSEQVSVAKDRRYELEVELWLRESSGTWKDPTGWTLLALGALAAGGGFAADFHRQSLIAGTPDEVQFKQLRDIGYITGGSAAGLALILLVWEALDTHAVKPEDKIGEGRRGELRHTLRPMVSPISGGGVVGADVRF